MKAGASLASFESLNHQCNNYDFLDLLFIPLLGNVGASIVSSITYGLSMILIAFLYKRMVGVGLRDTLVPYKEDFRLLGEVLRHILTRLKKNLARIIKLERVTTIT